MKVNVVLGTVGEQFPLIMGAVSGTVTSIATTKPELVASVIVAAHIVTKSAVATMRASTGKLTPLPIALIPPDEGDERVKLAKCEQVTELFVNAKSRKALRAICNDDFWILSILFEDRQVGYLGVSMRRRQCMAIVATGTPVEEVRAKCISYVGLTYSKSIADQLEVI